MFNIKFYLKHFSTKAYYVINYYYVLIIIINYLILFGSK